METAELSLVAKEARVPVEPVPELLYSPNVTPEVRVSEVLQTDQPAELMTLLIDVFWKTTRA